MSKTTTVTNLRGVRFTVRRVDQGDRYGRGDCLLHDKAEPLIEFYDARQAGTEGFGPLGQFVSRYYASTLTEIRSGQGLCLGIDDWQVSAANVWQVREALLTRIFTDAAAIARQVNERLAAGGRELELSVNVSLSVCVSMGFDEATTAQSVLDSLPALVAERLSLDPSGLLDSAELEYIGETRTVRIAPGLKSISG